MKKELLLLATLAVFSACSNEDLTELSTSNTPTSTMTFSATMEGEEGAADTRASIASNGRIIFWDKGDEISVLTRINLRNYNNKCTLSSGAGSIQGSFTGTCQTGTNIYAIYPYSNDNRIGANPRNEAIRDFFIDWNGINQTAVLGSFPLNTPMVAYTPNVAEGATNIPLSFRDVCAFVKVTTDYACKQIVFSAKGSEEYLAAKEIRVEYNNNQPQICSTDYGQSNTVTLTGKDGANLVAGTYYIAVMPRTLSQGFDLTFTNIYGEKTWTKSTSKSVTFKRGTVLNLGTIAIKSEMVKMAGSGTTADPYLIHDFDQLQHMRDFVNNSTGGGDCYKQVADIDGRGAEFTPIGTFGTEPHRFNGTYDGGGFTIKNIRPTTVQADHFNSYNNTYKKINFNKCFASALFAFVLDATIKNLTVENVEPSLSGGSNEEKNYIKSPLVAIAFSSENSSNNIENVTIKGAQTVLGDCNYYTYGGLVAVSTSNLNITNCTNYINISCQPDAPSLKIGGLIGMALDGHRFNPNGLFYDSFDSKVNISKCRNYGDFTLDFQRESSYYSCIGGIIGIITEGNGSNNVITNITNCVNFGDLEIKKTGEYYKDGCVGGIVGEMDSDGTISNNPYIQNCVNNGSIKSYLYAGGILGSCYDNDTQLKNCANTGTLIGKYTGSVVANGKGTLSGCDHKSTLDEYISAMNTNRPDNFCAWKYVAGTNNTKIDLDF